MFKLVKTTVLSAMIGLGGLAAMPANAQADGLYLNFGGNGARAGVFLGDNGGSYHRGPRWRERRVIRRCSPQRALNKARRIGVRHARVVRMNRRVIKVRGRSHGDRVVVRFGRGPRCPIVG